MTSINNTPTPESRIRMLMEQEGLYPSDIACALCDEDVAAGEYEGCSDELEGWYTTYQNLAEKLMRSEGIEC